MKLLHKVIISVFLKPELTQSDLDIEKRIIDCMKMLSAVDIDHEKLQITAQTVTGFNERKIKTFTLILEKESHTNAFLSKLSSALNSEQKSLLLIQEESRLDENLDFFIRLGLNELLRNEYYITESGDCFHIKMVIAAFPKTRKSAIKVIEKIFGEQLQQ